MEFPHTTDPLVAALQRLVASVGGYQAVADAAEVNDQSIYQIAQCKTDSKTGHPRSVGPSIRRRLDAAFPGWMAGHDLPSQPGNDNVYALPNRGLKPHLMQVGAAIQRLPNDERRRVAAAVMASWVNSGGSIEYLDMLLHVLTLEPEIAAERR